MIEPSDNTSDRHPALSSAFSAPTLLTNLPFALCAVDRKLRVHYTNPAWDLLVESSVSTDSPAVHLPDYLREPERSRWERLAQDILDEHEGCDTGSAHVLEVFPPSGQRRSLRVFAVPVRQSDGTPVGLLFAGFDAESIEMTEQQRQAEETARLDVARQLAATLNHQINNPLFIISATLEDMLAEASDPAQERMLSASLEAVWRVSEAVKQLSEIRQIVTTAYISGHPMIDLERSQERPE